MCCANSCAIVFISLYDSSLCPHSFVGFKEKNYVSTPAVLIWITGISDGD